VLSGDEANTNSIVFDLTGATRTHEPEASTLTITSQVFERHQTLIYYKNVSRVFVIRTLKFVHVFRKTRILKLKTPA